MVRGPQFEKHVRLFGKFDEILTVHRREYVEIKCHLDATEVFIADLIACSTCFGTIMPIIRSSRVLYSGCCLSYFVMWFSSCWSGVELRVMCPVCRMLPVVFKLLVWCGAEGYVSGLQDAG